MTSTNSFSAFAEKQGGGTTFLFGRKTWKKRWFAINASDHTIAYWESEAQQTSAPPLKPHLDFKGATVDVPGEHTTEAGAERWTFIIKFAAGVGDKNHLTMRTDTKAARDAFVDVLVKAGVKASGTGAPATGGADAAAAPPSNATAAAPATSAAGAAPIVASVDSAADSSSASSSSSSSGDAAAAAAAPSGKTPPPPPPRLTSSSVGIARPSTASSAHISSMGAAAAAAAASAAAEPEPVAPEPVAPGPAEDAAAAAAAAGDEEDSWGDSGAAATAADEAVPAPPTVPKPAPPAGPVPPEVEAAARDAQVAKMLLEEPLPEGWTMGTTDEGYVFYVSPSGESCWERPPAAA